LVLQDSGADAMDRVCQVQQAIEQKLEFMRETMAQVETQQKANAAASQEERDVILAVAQSLKEKSCFMCVRVSLLYLWPIADLFVIRQKEMATISHRCGIGAINPFSYVLTSLINHPLCIDFRSLY